MIKTDEALFNLLNLDLMLITVVASLQPSLSLILSAQNNFRLITQFILQWECGRHILKWDYSLVLSIKIAIGKLRIGMLSDFMNMPFLFK